MFFFIFSRFRLEELAVGHVQVDFRVEMEAVRSQGRRAIHRARALVVSLRLIFFSFLTIGIPPRVISFVPVISFVLEFFFVLVELLAGVPFELVLRLLHLLGIPVVVLDGGGGASVVHVLLDVLLEEVMPGRQLVVFDQRRSSQ